MAESGISCWPERASLDRTIDPAAAAAAVSRNQRGGPRTARPRLVRYTPGGAGKLAGIPAQRHPSDAGNPFADVGRLGPGFAVSLQRRLPQDHGRASPRRSWQAPAQRVAGRRLAPAGVHRRGAPDGKGGLEAVTGAAAGPLWRPAGDLSQLQLFAAVR